MSVQKALLKTILKNNKFLLIELLNKWIDEILEKYPVLEKCINEIVEEYPEDVGFAGILADIFMESISKEAFNADDSTA